VVGRKRLEDILEENAVVFKCPQCSEKIKVPVHILQDGVVVSCESCGDEIVETEKVI
jgi:predicted RNA-binding Zn-ribbon protein involved in translation (DUF1610 family)